MPNLLDDREFQQLCDRFCEARDKREGERDQRRGSKELLVADLHRAHAEFGHAVRKQRGKVKQLKRELEPLEAQQESLFAQATRALYTMAIGYVFSNSKLERILSHV